MQQQSEIEILSAKLEVLNKERKQLIGNQNIVKQELVSKLETLNKENKQLIEDQNIRQQELDSKLEARSKENRKLIEQSKLSDQKVSEQNSEIKMLNLELEALREKHKQLTDIHCKVKSECASLRKGVGQESEIKSEEQESEIKIEERESEIKGEEQESGIKSEEQESEKLKSEITPEIFTGMLQIICDRICKKGLICTIINIEKSYFEILITICILRMHGASSMQFSSIQGN